MSELTQALDELELLMKLNAGRHVMSVEEVNRCCRRMNWVRALSDSEHLDKISKLTLTLAIQTAMEIMLPMAIDELTHFKGLRESDINRIRAILGPQASDEDIAAELGTSARTIRRFNAHQRDADNIPSARGRRRARL